MTLRVIARRNDETIHPKQFVYKKDNLIKIHSLGIGLAIGVLFIVTFVVVLSSNRVARMNPVKSLKNN
ncbi:MAG: hypothetical protein IKW93_03810 [Bacteroidales bacterium]|nr:hypothetical protein [Bacteroidales bacterium]